MRKVGGIHPKIGHFLVNGKAFIEQAEERFPGIFGLEQWALPRAGRPFKKRLAVGIQPCHHPETAEHFTIFRSQDEPAAGGQHHPTDADLLGQHPVLDIPKICFSFSRKDFRY